MTSAAGPLPDRADESPGPIELAGQGEISSIVIGALECLEPEEQHLLRLRFMEGETLGEMATHLAISLEQAKYRLRRATLNLRKVLVNQYAFEEAPE